MMYTTHVISDYYTHKNALHQAIVELFKEYDGVIVYGHHMAGFCEMIRERIAGLNKKHSRCKPYEIWEDLERDYNQHVKKILISGVSGIEFLEVKGHFRAEFKTVMPIKLKPTLEDYE